jgi:FlaA1/EpsC-like NDP-sugar epimerase
MRWKLLLIASLLATLSGVGSILGIAYWLSVSINQFRSSNIFIFASLLVPLITVAYASIFVYRHTARRRRLQAFLTVLITAVLTFAAITLSLMFWSKRIVPPDASAPRNAA